LHEEGIKASRHQGIEQRKAEEEEYRKKKFTRINRMDRITRRRCE